MPTDLYEQTASLDDLILALQAVSPGVQLDVRQPKYFRWRARFLNTPHMLIWRAHGNADWTCTARQSAARFYVILPTDGALEATIHKEVRTTTGSHALVMTEQDSVVVVGRGNPENAQINMKWEPSAFQEVVAHVYDQDNVRAQPQPRLDLRSRAGQLFHFLARGLVAGHFQEIGGSPNASALISETMLRLIAEGSNFGADMLFTRVAAAASSRQVREAIDLMYGRLHEPLTLSALAAALGVSGRSLQHGFRRYHDTTPLAYLRNLRLEALHRELSNPQNTLSVGEVAAKWGFAHMGRLAKLYRAAYGRPPSETARLAQERR